MKPAQSILLALVLALGSSPALAEIIFDNFGPGNTHHDVGYEYIFYTENGFGAGLVYAGEMSMGFDVTGEPYRLDTVEFAVVHTVGPNRLIVSIMSGETLPETEITSVLLEDQVPEWGTTGSPVLVNFGNVILEPDTQYWLVLKTERTEEVRFTWYHNPALEITPGWVFTWWQDFEDQWESSGAYTMRVTATPQSVPTEASSLDRLKSLYR